MNNQRGFISGFLPSGWQVMAAMAALIGLLFWLYTSALEDKGALEQSNAQLTTDLAYQKRQTEEMQARNLREQKAVADAQKKLRWAWKEHADIQSKYREALSNDGDTRDWDRTILPPVVVDGLCRLTRADKNGNDTGTSTSSANGSVRSTRDQGKDERAPQAVCRIGNIVPERLR